MIILSILNMVMGTYFIARDKPRRCLLHIVLSLICFQSASAFEVEQDSTGAQIRWPNYESIEFHFQSHSSKQFRQAVLDCQQEWTNATGVKFVQGLDVAKESATGITYIFENKFTDYLADAINGGGTTPRSTSGVMIAATVVLNDKFYEWHRGAPTQRPGKIKIIDHSFDFILLHEIGHALGLAHNDLIDSIMYGRPGHTFVGSDDVLGIFYLSGKSK